MRSVIVAVWVGVATLVVEVALVGPPLSPARVGASAPVLLASSLVIGAIAGLAGVRAGHLVGALVGALAAHGVVLAIAASFAGVMQGNTVLMEPFRYGLLAGGTVAFLVTVLLGAQVVVGTMLRRGRRPAPRVLWGVAGAVAAGSLALGVLAAASPIALDPATPGIHRVHIGPAAITLDTVSIPQGRVIWLATVDAGAPYGLALVDAANNSTYVVETPPAGAEDFLLLRQTLTPGAWSFVAGDGRLTASFTVTP